MPWTYEKDPAAIYRQSFATIRAEGDLDRLPEPLWPVAIRLAHAVGDVGVIDALAWSDDAVASARGALAAGAPVLVDTEMVSHGIIRRFLTTGSPVVCALNDPRVADHAKTIGTTRSAAAVDLWEAVEGALVAIGNAPTALFHLLEAIEAGGPKPACVLGFPVGFIGAAESKDALIEAAPRLGVPYIALRGRRGGSALAAAAVNALAAPEESR